MQKRQQSVTIHREMATFSTSIKGFHVHVYTRHLGSLASGGKLDYHGDLTNTQI